MVTPLVLLSSLLRILVTSACQQTDPSASRSLTERSLAMFSWTSEQRKGRVEIRHSSDRLKLLHYNMASLDAATRN